MNTDEFIAKLPNLPLKSRGQLPEKSGIYYVIDDQSIDELKIIMRAIFLQYSYNNEANIGQQINRLNDMIINWSVPRIMSEIQQYSFYLNDITHMPQQLSHPVNMSGSGTKSFSLGPYM
jgi:hypothetical protein